MLLRLFKGTGPATLLFLVIILGLMWTGAFIGPHPALESPYETTPMPLYAIIRNLIAGHAIGGVILTLILAIAMLFLLTYFNTSIFFINERTYLPALTYVLITSIFPVNQVLNPALPAALLLMVGMMRIMDTYRKPGTAFNFFDAGLLIGIGSLFYANIIWFVILTVTGVFLLRSGNIKEPLLALIGLVTPYVLLAGFYYVLGKDPGILLYELKVNLFGITPEADYTRLTIILLAEAGLFLIISLVYLLMQMNSKKIKSRKTFFLLIWALLISIIGFIAIPSISSEIIWIGGIPVCYIISHYLVFTRKKLVPEIMFIGLFLLVVLQQILDIL